jgi:hypothetical protein
VDTLSNGLRLIIHLDPSAPVVTVNVWYHVGSGDEKPGRTGFAHLFEHLMFMGSEHAPYPEFDRRLEAVGANNNGSTTEDRTNYYEWGPANALPLMLWLEADRMGWMLPTMDSAKVDLQREVGLDTKSFARALRGVMRAAPDVILIGEIRDRETMEAAITLSGTGHLVLSTLHANNSAETMDRIINMFPHDQHKQVFLDLSQYLRAILSQRLVVSKDGKRMAAIEVMLNTPYISELVKKGDVSAIKEAIVASSERGVQSFDVALHNLYKQNRIELEEALLNADSRSNLEAKINFG